MNNETLTKERNFFLVGFIILVGIGLIFRTLMVNASPDAAEQQQAADAIMILVQKGFFVYLVFRLSRFLKQPVWLTTIYCLLTPFSVLYLIPFVGLLLGVKSARRATDTKQLTENTGD